VREQLKRVENSLSFELPSPAPRIVHKTSSVRSPDYERAPIQLDALGPDGYNRVPVAAEHSNAIRFHDEKEYADVDTKIRLTIVNLHPDGHSSQANQQGKLKVTKFDQILVTDGTADFEYITHVPEFQHCFKTIQRFCTYDEVLAALDVIREIKPTNKTVDCTIKDLEEMAMPAYAELLQKLGLNLAASKWEWLATSSGIDLLANTPSLMTIESFNPQSPGTNQSNDPSWLQNHVLNEYIDIVQKHEQSVLDFLNKFNGSGNAGYRWPPPHSGILWSYFASMYTPSMPVCQGQTLYGQTRILKAMLKKKKHTFLVLECIQMAVRGGKAPPFLLDDLTSGKISLAEEGLPDYWGNAEDSWRERLDEKCHQKDCATKGLPELTEATVMQMNETGFKSLLFDNMMLTCKQMHKDYDMNIWAEETMRNFAQSDPHDFGVYTIDVMMRCYEAMESQHKEYIAVNDDGNGTPAEQPQQEPASVDEFGTMFDEDPQVWTAGRGTDEWVGTRDKLTVNMTKGDTK